ASWHLGRRDHHSDGTPHHNRRLGEIEQPNAAVVVRSADCDGARNKVAPRCTRFRRRSGLPEMLRQDCQAHFLCSRREEAPCSDGQTNGIPTAKSPAATPARLMPQSQRKRGSQLTFSWFHPWRTATIRAPRQALLG